MLCVAHWSKWLSEAHPKSFPSCFVVFLTKELIGTLMKGRLRSLSCQEHCSRESRHDFMANDSLANIGVGCSEDNQVELS